MNFFLFLFFLALPRREKCWGLLGIYGRFTIAFFLWIQRKAGSKLQHNLDSKSTLSLIKVEFKDRDLDHYNCMEI